MASTVSGWLLVLWKDCCEYLLDRLDDLTLALMGEMPHGPLSVEEMGRCMSWMSRRFSGCLDNIMFARVSVFEKGIIMPFYGTCDFFY